MRGTGKSFDSPDRQAIRDVDGRDRYNFRAGRTTDGDNERTRDGRNNNLRVRRGEGEQDNDGWSTVKPRKSFGTEGAERFNGRMGLDRHKDERRFKDRDDRDPKERPQRGFDSYSRNQDGDHDQEREREGRRNGTTRGRNESTWFKDNNDVPPVPKDRNSNGDRLADRSRGWRDKERDDRVDRVDRGGDRGERGDRRWDRDKDQRQEREPEWLADPEEQKNQAHTQEDFQKWKEQMQGKDKAGKTPAEETLISADVGGGFFGIEKPKVDTPLAISTGPDKFFGKWAATPSQEPSPDSGIESKKEGIAKAKATGKASRFTSFFAPQEEPTRRQTETPQSMPTAPPAPSSSQGGLEGLFQNNSNPQSQEKEAFAALLRKLQQGSGSTPPINMAMQPKPPAPEKQQVNSISSPEPFQQYRTERQEDQRPSSTRNSQQALQDLLNNRQIASSQPSSRPEQMLQELVGQRQNAMSQSSTRPDQPTSRNNNTDFLMNLMQSAKAAPEPQRSESLLLRMPPQQKSMDRQLQQQLMEQDIQREAVQRERSASQRQSRPQPPPGFYDDPAIFQRGPPPQHDRQGGNPPQPIQILQRPPPPPGLELGWERSAQLPPPQHRMNQNIPPPPGLANGPNRALPPQQQMFPPGFPIGNFPPDMIPGPPRNVPMQPPPGFFNGGPPPGFMPPGIGGFQGPEGMAFGGPFDGRGPPPQGAFRRQ